MQLMTKSLYQQRTRLDSPRQPGNAPPASSCSTRTVGAQSCAPLSSKCPCDLLFPNSQVLIDELGQIRH